MTLSSGVAELYEEAMEELQMTISNSRVPTLIEGQGCRDVKTPYLPINRRSDTSLNSLGCSGFSSPILSPLTSGEDNQSSPLPSQLPK
ncbi:hypothetical protein QL285_077549 [Trifolium repens]|nr:hypothetical protein QL285_077549 [Trifolium repens]